MVYCPPHRRKARCASAHTPSDCGRNPGSEESAARGGYRLSRITQELGEKKFIGGIANW